MEKRIDLQNFNDDHMRARGKGSLLESKGQEFDRDRYELARVGKKQVLKVSFAFKDGLSGLTALASVWFGFYDWSFLWVRFAVLPRCHSPARCRIAAITMQQSKHLAEEDGVLQLVGQWLIEYSLMCTWETMLV